MLELHRVEPGSRFRIGQVDAGATPGWKDGKRRTVEALAELSGRLHELQNRLWAEHRRKVLVVLQGMDTSGKDGTISHVFEGVNPLGVRVTAFGEPSREELAHDFLWRVHARVPGAGELAIFNRSHYEAVLVERVKQLVPAKVWKARYAQINDFERLLAESGTKILKFFLHIDRDEQRQRLERRIAAPQKRWKFSVEDLEDRRLWDEFMAAYEEAIRRTSTDAAPWLVVPANKKWYRNLVVATALVQTLERMQLRYPTPKIDLSRVKVE